MLSEQVGCVSTDLPCNAVDLVLDDAHLLALRNEVENVSEGHRVLLIVDLNDATHVNQEANTSLLDVDRGDLALDTLEGETLQCAVDLLDTGEVVTRGRSVDCGGTLDWVCQGLEVHHR